MHSLPENLLSSKGSAAHNPTGPFLLPLSAAARSAAHEQANVPAALPLQASGEQPVTYPAYQAGSGACSSGYPEVEGKYHLPQAWGTYLEGFPWDWFITVVPNNIIHPESLEKLWRVFIHHLNRYVYGHSYWKDKNKGVLWAIGWERQRRGAPHGHGLIGGLPDYVSRNQFYQWLKDHSAQFSDISVYEKSKGAEFYMSKSMYAWKNGEIDISDTLARYQGSSWISAKESHEQFCKDYGQELRAGVSAYVWES